MEVLKIRVVRTETRSNVMIQTYTSSLTDASAMLFMLNVATKWDNELNKSDI